jgi:ankyrin repeat protein
MVNENNEKKKKTKQNKKDNREKKRFFFFFFFFFFKGAVGCATLLTESGGAAINAVNKLACTPLHSAVFAGHVPLAELLLQRGADVHTQDRDGMTPLHWAVAERRFALIEPLVNGTRIALVAFSSLLIVHCVKLALGWPLPTSVA